MMNAYLADVTLIIHLIYIGFVVFGLLSIVLGYFFRWSWVCNPWFRWLHLLAISIVVFESLMGIRCPLTTLELYFREEAGQDATLVSYGEKIPEISDCMWSFRKLLFPGCTPEFFVPIYLGFAFLILSTFFLKPPRWPRFSWMRTGGESIP